MINPSDSQAKQSQVPHNSGLLLPKNSSPNQEVIKARAYLLSKAAPWRTAEENWVLAEQELSRPWPSRTQTTIWRWCGFSEKNGWDWLDFLARLSIPVVIAVGGWLISSQSASQQLKINQSNQKDSIVSDYVKSMNTLILVNKVDKASASSPVSVAARTLTLTSLSRVGAYKGDYSLHKRNILLFLQEAGLINRATQRISLRGADLSGANLSGVDLSGANLSVVNFNGANLREANLSGADLRGAKFTGADLSSANLSEAIIDRFDPGYSDFVNVDFFRANLSKANLSRVDLSSADFSGANLSGADLSSRVGPFDRVRQLTDRPLNFSEANLSGANLRGTNLLGANLNGALLKNTTCPDGKVVIKECSR